MICKTAATRGSVVPRDLSDLAGGSSCQARRRSFADTYAALATLPAARKAWSRSARMSSMCSMPTDRRT